MGKARTGRREATQVEGYDGRVLVDASVRLTQTRFEDRQLRCVPGSFEWRYGRKTANSALYHAGIAIASLWERAEIGSSASPDLRRSHGGGWKGLPDNRTEAIDQIKQARQDIGRWSMARLVDYCVIGSTVRQIADKYNESERSMSTVLEADLKAAADHFSLL